MRKGARASPTRGSTSRTAASSASICVRWSWSRKRWWAVTRPCRASTRVARGALRRPVVRATRRSGSASPATNAVRIARPLARRTSLTTPVSFTLASSSTFLDAQGVLGDLPYELLARAGEVAQLRRAASDSLFRCARFLAARARGAAGHAPGDLADAWPRSWSPRLLRTGAPSRAPATWRAGPRCARAITRARPSPDPDSM